MPEDEKVDSRAWLKKTLVTVAALVAVCGLVLAMRWGAKEIVVSSGLGGSGSSPAVEPRYFPAPHEYELARLIPEDLKRDAGGLFVKAETTIMPMPYEQALEVSKAEAAGAGWEPFELPLTMEFAQIAVGGAFYIRPDRFFVSRSHVSLKDGTTRRDDLVFPFGDLEGARHDLTMDEIIALRGDRVGQRLPNVIRDVLVGRIFYTQFVSHQEGASFLVVALSPHGAGMVRSELRQKLRVNGWTRDEQNAPGVWRRGNLAVSYDVSARGDEPGSFVSARFSDDDVLLKREDEEAGK